MTPPLPARAYPVVGFVAVVGAALLVLAFDPYGAPQWVCGVTERGPTAAVAVDVPPGTYHLDARARFVGQLEGVSCRLAGALLEHRPLRSESTWPIVDVPLGTVVIPRGPHVARISPGAPMVALVLTPMGSPATATGRTQRMALALFVLATGWAFGWRRPHLLVITIAALWLARYLVHDLVLYGSGDLRTFFAPSYELGRRWLAAGIIPLWNPHCFFGVPHLADMQTMSCYPPMALARWLSLPYGLAGPMLYVGHMVLGGIGMIHAARTVGVRDAVGQTVAGVGYMLAPSVLAYEQDAATATLAWLPWIFVAHLGRRTLLACAILAMALCAGHLQLLLYGWLGAALLAILAGRGESPLRRVGRVVGSAVGGVLLASIMVLPMLDFGTGSIRARGLNPAHASSGAIGAEDVRRAARLDWLDRLPALVGTSATPGSVASGPLLWPLALVGLAGAPAGRRRAALVLALLGVLGVLLAVGDVDGAVPFVARLPVLGSMRAPGRALILTALSTVLLAAMALQHPLRRTLRARLCLVAGGLPWAAYGLLAVLGRAPDDAGAILAHSIVAAGVVGVGLRASGVWLLCALVVGDRVDELWCQRPGAPRSALAVYGHGRAGPGRDLVLPPLNPSDSMVTGRLSVWGHNPIIPMRAALVLDQLSPLTFRFDDEGRLLTLFPALDQSLLAAANGPAALRAMGVGQLWLPVPARRALMERARVENVHLLAAKRRLSVVGAARAHVVSTVREVRDLAEGLEVWAGARGVCVLASDTAKILPRHERIIAIGASCGSCDRLRLVLVEEVRAAGLRASLASAQGDELVLYDRAPHPAAAAQVSTFDVPGGWRMHHLRKVELELPVASFRGADLVKIRAGDGRVAILDLRCSNPAPAGVYDVPLVETGREPGSVPAAGSRGSEGPPAAGAVETRDVTPQHVEIDVPRGSGGGGSCLRTRLTMGGEPPWMARRRMSQR